MLIKRQPAAGRRRRGPSFITVKQSWPESVAFWRVRLYCSSARLKDQPSSVRCNRQRPQTYALNRPHQQGDRLSAGTALPRRPGQSERATRSQGPFGMSGKLTLTCLGSYACAMVWLDACRGCPLVVAEDYY